MNTRENLDSTWNSDLLQIGPLSARLDNKNDFRFHSGQFSNGKAIFIVRKCAMNFLTTTLPLRAYLFTFAVFVTVIIYVQNGFSVGR